MAGKCYPDTKNYFLFLKRIFCFSHNFTMRAHDCQGFIFKKLFLFFPCFISFLCYSRARSLYIIAWFF